MKSLHSFRLVWLAVLILAGSTGFGPRTYTHPRYAVEAKNYTTAVGQTPAQNGPLAGTPAAPAFGQKPPKSEAVTLTHTLVESMARGVKAVGEALADALAGLAVSLVNALFSLFGQRSTY